MSIQKVLEFHNKFSLPEESSPGFPVDEDMDFRVHRQAEEGDELYAAWQEDNFVGAFDALLDTAYIVYGTALRMGITPEMWDAGFEAVHAANMRKERATNPSQSKYGTTVDIIKPAGWIGPEDILRKILGVNN